LLDDADTPFVERDFVSIFMPPLSLGIPGHSPEDVEVGNFATFSDKGYQEPVEVTMPDVVPEPPSNGSLLLGKLASAGSKNYASDTESHMITTAEDTDHVLAYPHRRTSAGQQSDHVPQMPTSATRVLHRRPRKFTVSFNNCCQEDCPEHIGTNSHEVITATNCPAFTSRQQYVLQSSKFQRESAASYRSKVVANTFQKPISRQVPPSDLPLTQPKQLFRDEPSQHCDSEPWQACWEGQRDLSTSESEGAKEGPGRMCRAAPLAKRKRSSMPGGEIGHSVPRPQQELPRNVLKRLGCEIAGTSANKKQQRVLTAQELQEIADATAVQITNEVLGLLRDEEEKRLASKFEVTLKQLTSITPLKNDCLLVFLHCILLQQI
jgi:hypothetical protein